MNKESRVIVVPIIRNNEDQVLICKMPQDRGVFPGMWALPGGGVEPGETMVEALKREVREELGISVTDIEPWYFSDDTRTKIKKDGTKVLTYMIFLLFECRAESLDVKINDEFEAYAWVKPSQLKNYNLNPASIETFKKKRYL